MTQKTTRSLLLLTVIVSMMGCSDPDIHYTVTIREIQKNKDAYYCVYVISQETDSEPKFPTESFVDTCDKYQVGETVVLSR
jgi:hypothetical protein